MPSKFGGNILDFSAQQPPTALNFHLTPSAAFSFSEFQATSHASQLHYGSYTSDLARGKYNLSRDPSHIAYINPNDLSTPSFHASKPILSSYLHLICSSPFIPIFTPITIAFWPPYGPYLYTYTLSQPYISSKLTYTPFPFP